MKEGTPEWALREYRRGRVPKGWYAHGRGGVHADLSDKDFYGGALFATVDLNVAEDYAVDGGSIWFVRPTSEASEFDADDNIEDIIAAVIRAYRDGDQTFTPYVGANASDDKLAAFARNAFNPPDLNASGGAFDQSDLIDWFSGQFGNPDIVTFTGQGAVFLTQDKIEAVRIPGAATISSRHSANGSRPMRMANTNNTITLNVYTCTRCGYTWVQSPRAASAPKNCASKKCKSPYWNKPRQVKP